MGLLILFSRDRKVGIKHAVDLIKKTIL